MYAVASPVRALQTGGGAAVLLGSPLGRLGAGVGGSRVADLLHTSLLQAGVPGVTAVGFWMEGAGGGALGAGHPRGGKLVDTFA